ncbi:MAG: pyridoxal phosphate-dependent aminotransferase [Micrococcales bacterium]|nr:pyridoxal phosphate-dependent aminotransferase [Micrococcales bacterium]
MLAAALDQVSGYEPDPRGPVAAREALAGRYGGTPDDYWLASSTSLAYTWLLTVTCDPGDAVAVPVPGYPLVEPLARFAGVRTVGYPLFYVHPHGWSVDTDALADVLAAPDVRAVVVVSPGNPTGAYVEPTTAHLVADLCARHQVTLIADEVFAPFWLDRGSPAPSLADVADDVTVAVLDGLSKSLAAPQLKAAWLRLSGADEVFAQALDAVADAYLSVSAPVACALPNLLGLVDDQVPRVRARLAANLATARAVLAAPCRVRRTDGGWSVLVDVPRTRDDDTLATHVLHAGLCAHPGWLYDLPDPATLSLSLLLDPDQFADGCRRLRAVVVVRALPACVSTVMG